RRQTRFPAKCCAGRDTSRSFLKSGAERGIPTRTRDPYSHTKSYSYALLHLPLDDLCAGPRLETENVFGNRSVDLETGAMLYPFVAKCFADLLLDWNIALWVNPDEEFAQSTAEFRRQRRELELSSSDPIHRLPSRQTYFMGLQ